ncbi:hypothetical protein AGRA3207_007533 [Actinomadura graeca]|uniref:Uncharacterized protein n=1 Tax=Actinomadura graeca TaxID=2750812 RepID=A0ABX8R4H9_9ACTN|nr:hypothetical protein [Actinomadura graeca]QXJ25964.1 hypothetical protein AGRA3207_007533 [Actinomadura graeca]
MPIKSPAACENTACTGRLNSAERCQLARYLSDGLVAGVFVRVNGEDKRVSVHRGGLAGPLP